MKYFFATLLVLFSTALPLSLAYSDPSPIPIASVVPVAAALPPTAPGVVAVPEVSAPPEWAQSLMLSAQALPVVGPVISKALLYLGILSSTLTMLVACLITFISSLSALMNLAGLVRVSAALAAFQNGRLMYWLKYFSLFNASKTIQPAKVPQ